MMARATRRSRTSDTTEQQASSPPAPPPELPSPTSPPPSTLRRPTSHRATDHDVDGNEGALVRLRFSQPLSWRAGRAIPVAELLKRLETLARELRQYEQEELDVSSLQTVTRQLASGHLLAHRDKGVRAWTACCLVDVLRLCAPNAPFTGNELRDIFTTFITSIIPALADPSNAYNEQHIYVLSSLAEVKSIVLLTDLDNADTLILSLFSSCFDIVSGSTKASTGEELAKKVEYDMVRLLVPVIDEAPVLSPEVIDVIIAQFLRVDPRALGAENQPAKGGKRKHATAAADPKQKTLLPKVYPPAYNMTKALCSACPEKMASYVSQYFNNVILDASASSRSINGMGRRGTHSATTAIPNDSEDEPEDIAELSKAHRLIRELWRACPDVLQNVVPQIEAELSAENVSLRLLATQTIGDMVSGIGVAGPPPPPPLHPAAYPPAKLSPSGAVPAFTKGTLVDGSILLTPLSTKPFAQVHSSAYASFLSRRQDRSATVRAAWVTAVGRIIRTNAGCVGVSNAESAELIASLGKMLVDGDENVRIATIEVLELFDLDEIIYKIASDGGVDAPDSALGLLAERVKDRRQPVREVAMRCLSRMWGVASGELEQGSETVTAALKDIPSRIFGAFYANNAEIELLITQAMCESLLPLTYPPIKTKAKDKEKAAMEATADMARTRRILTLTRYLDDRAKRVFFLLQTRQLNLATFMRAFLDACEEYNGGIMDAQEDETKEKLTRIISAIAKTLPDPSKAADDLWKFAMAHDRRNYHLIRFAMDLNSDYKTVVRATRELTKRLEDSNSPLNSTFRTSLLPLVHRSSSLIFNKSHVPAIMEISRRDDMGLSSSAHEMLKEMSTHNPEVLKAHVAEICKDIEAAAPATLEQGPGPTRDIEQLLKACAGFARKMPGKVPQDRKFMQALTRYAMFSRSPQAAKHAVTTLMAVTDKKEMYAKELVRSSVDGWTYGMPGFLTRLATIAQVNLLAPDQADEASEQIISIATDQILLKNRASKGIQNTDYTWDDHVDDETAAKTWALRVLANRIRSKQSSTDDDAFKNFVAPVFTLLTTLVAESGELSKDKDTPATQKSHLRLIAANLILKLCSSKVLCDRLFEPQDFNKVALVVQDPLFPVRSGFVAQLKKRLTRASHLGVRWYTIPFLLAFEPDLHLKESTLTWARSRTVFFTKQAKSEHQTVMELLASRLLSLLAHHPDYPSDSLDETVRTEELADFSRYILFYLSAVANETNLSLIFHIFQRVKQVRDAISGQEAISQRLYTLSDLAQATTRKYADIYSQQHKIGGVGGHAVNILQTYPGKMRLPSSLFANLASHTLAQEIAETNFLSEDVDDRLDRIVRAFMKPPRHGQHHRRQAGPGGVAPMPARKRKSDGSRTSSSRSEKSPKRVKQGRQSTLTGQSMGDSSKSRASHRKRQQGLDDNGWGSDTNGADEAHSGPAASGTSSSARRRSGRRTSGNNVSYAEPDSDEDEEAMLGADQQEVTENEEEEDDDDGMSSDTDGSDHEGDGAVLPSEQMQEELTTEDAGPGSRAGSAAPSAGEGDAADSEDESVGAAPPEEAAGPAPLTNASNRLPQRSSLPGAKQAVLTSGDTRTRRSQRRAAR